MIGYAHPPAGRDSVVARGAAMIAMRLVGALRESMNLKKME
jgi:hypothetical protein